MVFILTVLKSFNGETMKLFLKRALLNQRSVQIKSCPLFLTSFKVQTAFNTYGHSKSIVFPTRYVPSYGFHFKYFKGGTIELSLENSSREGHLCRHSNY